jgi:hypothetical protein
MPSTRNARAKVFKVDRFGTIDGVDIDLLHKLLDPREWDPPLWLDSAYPPLDHPYIWFPWFGHFNPEALRRRALQRATNEYKIVPEKTRTSYEEIDAARLDTQKRIDENAEKYIQANTPECVVRDGDKIRVDRVERKHAGTELDHPDDHEIRLAYLRVQRPDGTVDKLNTPIVYQRQTKLPSHDGAKSYFEKISSRILKHFGINNLKEIRLVEKDDSLAYQALRKAYLVEVATDTDPEHAVVIGRAGTDEEHDGSDPWNTIEDAVMMGYLWGRAEQDRKLMSLAEEMVKNREALSRAGKLGSKTRSLKQHAWQRVARHIVEDLVAKNPALNQTDVIRKIDTGKWQAAQLALNSKAAMVGDASLKAFVSSIWEEKLIRATIKG